jgi:hypothetical protein
MTMKSTEARPQGHLGHSMKPRQLTMMGLGSAIGAGLFLGSGAGVQAAGPAVLISYLVAGTLIILVMWALGEMAAANPNSGAFSVYAERALGKTAGATIGWLWWLQLVVVIAAEALGAAGLLFTVWPVVPVWALALIFMVVFTAINLAGVRNFGEFEFWFAILKVRPSSSSWSSAPPFSWACCRTWHHRAWPTSRPISPPRDSAGSRRPFSWSSSPSAALRLCPWRRQRPKTPSTAWAKRSGRWCGASWFSTSDPFS